LPSSWTPFTVKFKLFQYPVYFSFMFRKLELNLFIFSFIASRRVRSPPPSASHPRHSQIQRKGEIPKCGWPLHHTSVNPHLSRMTRPSAIFQAVIWRRSDIIPDDDQGAYQMTLTLLKTLPSPKRYFSLYPPLVGDNIIISVLCD